MKPRLPLLTLALLVLLAGCSATGTTTGPVVDGEPDRVVKDPATPASAPPPPPESGHAPYADLMHRARVARDAGDYEQALTLLERAQRIDPDSAEIYLALAQTHRVRGDLPQSRATAERGLLYCVNAAQCDALRALTR